MPPAAPFPPSPPPHAMSHCVPSTDGHTRIVGGAEYNSRFYEFLVSMQTASGFHYCGGTLISSHWVLTAAHCTVRIGSIVRVGVGKLSEASGTDACVQTRTVKHVIDHPECVRSTRPTHARARTDAAGALLHRYDSNTVEHDIAIVELQVLCYA